MIFLCLLLRLLYVFTLGLLLQFTLNVKWIWLLAYINKGSAGSIYFTSIASWVFSSESGQRVYPWFKQKKNQVLLSVISFQMRNPSVLPKESLEIFGPQFSTCSLKMLLCVQGECAAQQACTRGCSSREFINWTLPCTAGAAPAFLGDTSRTGEQAWGPLWQQEVCLPDPSFGNVKIHWGVNGPLFVGCQNLALLSLRAGCRETGQ